MFKRKKSAIHERAKRLLGAFATESRKQKTSRGQRKLIRAQYENGLLLLKEDFITLPFAKLTDKTASKQPIQSVPLLKQNTHTSELHLYKAQELLSSANKTIEPIGNEKLRLILNEIVELMSIIKGELQKFEQH